MVACLVKPRLWGGLGLCPLFAGRVVERNGTDVTDDGVGGAPSAGGQRPATTTAMFTGGVGGVPDGGAGDILEGGGRVGGQEDPSGNGIPEPGEAFDIDDPACVNRNVVCLPGWYKAPGGVPHALYCDPLFDAPAGGAKMDVASASESCSAMGGAFHFATIDSAEERDDVVALILGPDGPWIDAGDPTGTCHFEWVTREPWTRGQSGVASSGGAQSRCATKNCADPWSTVFWDFPCQVLLPWMCPKGARLDGHAEVGGFSPSGRHAVRKTNEPRRACALSR